MRAYPRHYCRGPQYLHLYLEHHRLPRHLNTSRSPRHLRRPCPPWLKGHQSDLQRLQHRQLQQMLVQRAKLTEHFVFGVFIIIAMIFAEITRKKQGYRSVPSVTCCSSPQGGFRSEYNHTSLVLAEKAIKKKKRSENAVVASVTWYISLRAGFRQ